MLEKSCLEMKFGLSVEKMELLSFLGWNLSHEKC